jgi:type I restriction enzyme M protein
VVAGAQRAHHRAGRASDNEPPSACATTCWHSFSTALEAIGLLDPFQVRGIVAGFWYDRPSTTS